MVTKFEKRIIAVLLAVIMCVPTAVIPAIQVKAESEKEAVSQNSIGKADLQQNAADHADGDNEDDGSASGMENGIADNTGNAQANTRKNDIGDGAFIPIEEETVDESNLAENAQESAVNAQNVQESENSVYTETNNEELEEIVLKPDGQPVRISTKIDTYGEVVKYQFQPEESGTYYINLTGYTSGYQVYKKTEFGQTWVESSYNRFQLQRGETYYIEIQSYSSESVSVKWDFGKVQDLTPGSYETVISEPGQKIHYRLIYGISDLYCFNGAGYEANILFRNGMNVHWIYSAEYYKLNRDEECYIEVSFSNSEKTGTISWGIGEPESEAIELDQEIITYVEEDEPVKLYSFVPESNGTYSVSETNSNIYDSEWKWQGSKQADLTAGETYYILLPSYRDQKVIWKVQKVENVKIQIGTVYETSQDKPMSYELIPEQSGRYHVKSEQGVSLVIGDGSVENQIGRGSDIWIYLESGKTYEIIVDNNSYTGVEKVNWSVNKVNLEEIREGDEIVTSAAEHTEYQFVPQSSGYYLVSSQNQGKCSIYDNAWSSVTAYCYNESMGFGANVYLEQGETYYIHISPTEENAAWNINSLQTTDEYSYRILDNGTVEILKYTGNSVSVDVPETINGNIVTSIGYGAFAENSNLEEVTIPSKVSDLQYGAFQSCKNLKSVKFEQDSELQTIGSSTFYSCEKLTDIVIPDGVEEIGKAGFAESGLISIDIPDSVINIEDNLFYYCDSLSEVTLGKGMEQIGRNMFYGCSALKEIDIPENITTIGRYAFCGSGLTTISIPDSVLKMEGGVFSGCRSLSQVKLGNGIQGIEGGMFYGCSQLQEIIIPDGITYIGETAFYSSGLTSVDIPDSVTSIGENAFANCVNLKKADIGNGTAYIAISAFSGCDLTDLVIGNQVEEIGIRAFQSNANLKSVTIPNSVTKIEYSAFQGCTSLLEIEIPDSVEAIGQDAFDGTAWYDAQEDGAVYMGKVLYKYKGEISTDNSVITVQDGTKGIAGGAFYQQKELKEIVIPEGVTNIGMYAFLGCESLKAITIPTSVTEIGTYALGYLSKSGRPIEGFTIYGASGSAAQSYAEENGFQFVAVEPPYVSGDVNEDGEINISDLRLVLRKVCGKAELTSSQELAADVEKDGAVDIKDLRKILRFVCGKIDSFE